MRLPLPPQVVLAMLGSTACQPAHRPPLEVTAALHLAATPTTLGTLVYEGTVRRQGADGAPLYRYERRVSDLEGTVRSTHLTSTPSGAPVLLHQADHSPTYQLVGFREIHSQTGLVGQVDVHPDGTATFRTTVDGRTRTRVEPPGDPLHVGPTLFGHVLRHWDSLVAGEVHLIRFAVLDQRRSYRFALRKVDGPEDATTFEMAPRSRLVGLMLPRTTMVFDRDRNVVRYSGRVPPLEEVGRRQRPLDATVTYELTAETYR